jgi:hypothetical protein
MDTVIVLQVLGEIKIEVAEAFILYITEESSARNLWICIFVPRVGLLEAHATSF